LLENVFISSAPIRAARSEGEYPSIKQWDAYLKAAGCYEQLAPWHLQVGQPLIEVQEALLVERVFARRGRHHRIELVVHFTRRGAQLRERAVTQETARRSDWYCR
jgi:hypothetical protein